MISFIKERLLDLYILIFKVVAFIVATLNICFIVFSLALLSDWYNYIIGYIVSFTEIAASVVLWAIFWEGLYNKYGKLRK